MAGLLGRWATSLHYISRSFNVLKPHIGRIIVQSRRYKLYLLKHKHLGLCVPRKVTLSAGLASALVGSMVWCYCSGQGKTNQDPLGFE